MPDRQAIDEEAAARARRLNALHMAALTVLLEQTGGSVTFTEAEYQAVIARHGGSKAFNVRAEVIREAGQPDRVEVRLERKAAGQGDLPV